MIYLLNSSTLTSYGDYRFEGPLDTMEAREKLSEEYISAIDHDATAALLSKLLRRIIPVNSMSVAMQPGDKALIFTLSTPLPKGAALSAAELANVEYELGWLERLA